MNDYSVIPEKPNISLYVGRKVVKVFRYGDEKWQWVIELEGEIQIVNYSPRETVVPNDLVGHSLISFSMGMNDTTLHLTKGDGGSFPTVVKWSLKPTSYTIRDPRHGGEVIPQWPEELEERKIFPEDIGKISDEASDEWPTEYQRLTAEGDTRAQTNAAKFLEEE